MAFIRQEREAAAAVENIVKFVTFALGKEKYAVPVLRVKEIIARYDIAPLPKTPVFVEGIISLRGDIIPVVDLRKRFDLPVRDRTDETRLIVLEMDDFYVGIEVDAVFEVIKINADQIEPPPALVAGLQSDYLEGVCEIDNKLITILNLDEIFSQQEKKALQVSKDVPGGQPTPASQPKVAERAAEPPSRTEKAAPQPPPKAAGPARSLTAKVESDGRIKADGRSFFIGKNFAGKDLQIELSDKEVRVLEGGNQIKSFKRAG